MRLRSAGAPPACASAQCASAQCASAQCTWKATKRASAADRMCVICQDDITDVSAQVTLSCGHSFHGQCICDHLRRDDRCPICRDSLDGYVSEDEEDSSLCLNDAIKAARNSGDARTKRMLKTMNRLTKERAAANRNLKRVRDELCPLEDELESKIEKYASKKEAEFNKANMTLLNDYDTKKKELKKLRARATQQKRRIAAKHGWRRLSRRF